MTQPPSPGPVVPDSPGAEDDDVEYPYFPYYHPILAPSSSDSGSSGGGGGGGGTRPSTSTGTGSSGSIPPPPPPRIPPFTLLQPSSQKKSRQAKPKVFRVFRSVVRSFPIFTPNCRLNGAMVPRLGAGGSTDGRIHGAQRMTGTLFGHRKARMTLAIQENPRSLPVLLLELGIPTARFMQEMGSGLLRVALECEKRPEVKRKLLEEPLWTAFVNGRKIGYGTRRDVPTEADLSVMQTLHAMSMGAGVLPADMTDPADGELTYMRAHFDRVVGSKDSETFYMQNPDGNSGPELSVFFVRI